MSGVIRKVIVGAAVVAGMLSFSVPAMATDGVFAGVYPSLSSAMRACEDGKAQGRWDICSFVQHADGQVELWINSLDPSLD
ncbi:hypothetical protein ABT324_02400 [Saccharopolyspora sp. NPDC000359]|uniref:hypothetical protein n=1 Tax=Saccharopolyspora sp. NPDC000359 TaxID=3154251 RepID=UPI00332F42CB